MKITRKIIKGTAGKSELMESVGWLTNGQWVLRADMVNCQFRPDNDRTPDVAGLVKTESQRAAKAVAATPLRWHDSVLFATPAGEPTVWINALYADAFAEFDLYAVDDLSPIHIRRGDETIGLLIPMRCDGVDLPLLRRLVGDAALLSPARAILAVWDSGKDDRRTEALEDLREVVEKVEGANV